MECEELVKTIDKYESSCSALKPTNTDLTVAAPAVILAMNAMASGLGQIKRAIQELEKTPNDKAISQKIAGAGSKWSKLKVDKDKDVSANIAQIKKDLMDDAKASAAALKKIKPFFGDEIMKKIALIDTAPEAQAKSLAAKMAPLATVLQKKSMEFSKGLKNMAIKADAENLTQVCNTLDNSIKRFAAGK